MKTLFPEGDAFPHQKHSEQTENFARVLAHTLESISCTGGLERYQTPTKRRLFLNF